MNFPITGNLLSGVLFHIQAKATESEHQNRSKLVKHLKFGPLNSIAIALQHKYMFFINKKCQHTEHLRGKCRRKKAAEVKTAK